MPTSSERKALWFFALVALSGSTVRMVRASRTPADRDAASALEHQLARLDSVRQRPRAAQPKAASSGRRRRASGRADTNRLMPSVMSPGVAAADAAALIDLDRADSAVIETLPGIGPAIAARIVANRDSAGPFGAVEALCDVRGIGPAMVAKLRPLVTFTGPRRPLSDACGTASARARKTSSARGREQP